MVLFKGDRSAWLLAAEVQFLFSAPISRRGLVHAKLVRGQLAILVNVMIWTVFLAAVRVPAGWQRALRCGCCFSTLTFAPAWCGHCAANALEHERSGQRRKHCARNGVRAVRAPFVGGVQ